MARQGREFELLIKRIEEIILPKGAKISSPAYLEDRITHEMREVDILIEGKMGTFPIKIVIECRDRNALQDTTWMEQVHTKLNDVHVNKIIVVSSSPYTKPAMEKAMFYNIEARTYEEVDNKLINSWCSLEVVQLSLPSIEIISAQIEPLNEKLASISMEGENFDTKSFYLNDSYQGITILQLMQVADSTNKSSIAKGLIANGPPIRKRHALEFNRSDTRLTFKQCESVMEVGRIIVESNLRLHQKKFPVTRISKYSSGKIILSYVVKVQDFPFGKDQVLEFLVNEDGTIILPSGLKGCKTEFYIERIDAK